jgi:3-oxoacyl-[acyl-carrier protein] reductase
MEKRLDGKVALVTGGARGIGLAIAARFAREGAKVVIGDIDGDEAARVAGALGPGGNVLGRALDITKEAQITATVANTEARFGRLDILVNNAGFSHRNKPMLEVSEDDYDRIFAVNVKAIYLAALEVVPLFRGQGGGSIINTSSTAALRPRPNLACYNASKGAVNVLTKSMAVEFAPDRIRVNALCPVVGETGMLETFLGVPDTPENRAKFMASIPLGRFSTPRDVANAALYLASDEADFITGLCLEVDGGRCV